MQYDPATFDISDDWTSNTGLQNELAQARRDIRRLERELRKAGERIDEIGRAYRMTVENLVRTSGTCAILENERDIWRRRAEARSTDTMLDAGGIVLRPDEVAAIRKAVARLHHPDAGGDSERMKQWNTALDVLEAGMRETGRHRKRRGQ